MAARLSANMAITAIIPTPVPRMASTGPIGSRVGCLSAQALGITDIGVAATTVAGGVAEVGGTADSMAVDTADMVEDTVAAGMAADSTVATRSTAVEADSTVVEELAVFTAAVGADTAVVTANRF